jgi:hypothetical protein
MERFDIKRPFTRAAYLDTLLREFGVSLLQADDHYSKNQSELCKMNLILDSKREEDIWKCLTLLHILTHGNSYEMVRKYCLRQERPDILNDKDNDLLVRITKYTENYKLDFLAALFDDILFAQVKEWYRVIDAFRDEDENSEPVSSQMYKTIFFFIKKGKVILSPEITAGTADDELMPLYNRFSDDTNSEYCGDLSFWGYEQDQILEIRFQFKDKITGKPLEKIPFDLDDKIINVEFVYDNSPRNIRLNNIMKTKSATIRSGNVPIDWSKGFEDITIKILQKS